MKKLQILCISALLLLAFGDNSRVKADQILGSDGKNGVNGKDGKNGENRDGITIFLSNDPVNLDLTGQKGYPGEDGTIGESAVCPAKLSSSQENMQGANGGSGGNGGNGGIGGNGGAVTLYTTNPALLKRVFINSAGGAGGNGGNGGSGGSGCNCPEPFVSLQSCQGSPGDSGYSCSTKQFRCISGRSGVNGSKGVSGSSGLPGTLTVINSIQPLVEDQTNASVTFKQLKENGYTLSKNVWETKNGARSILAPNSIVQDQYRYLASRSEYSFLMVWNTTRPFERFADQVVTLKLKDNPSPTIDYKIPDGVWIDAKEQKQNKRTDLIVYNALLKEEAIQLEIVKLVGKEANLQLIVVDNANVSDLVNTQWEAIIKTSRSDPRFRATEDYITRYQGPVPSRLIDNKGNLFTLNLGQLQLNSKELRNGVGILIKLKVKRSMGNYMAQQNLKYENLLQDGR